MSNVTGTTGTEVEITPETAAKLAALRDPFPAEYVAYRPQPWCSACSKSREKTCGARGHEVIRCEKCKQRITKAHLDLSYVGHAETTDRLLKCDPAWTWEPQAREIDPQVLAAAAASGNPEVVKAVIESAPPKLDQHGGLWIRLTVHGVTRPGYGDAQGKQPGPNAIKEIIGDAIRNAAMRFGVGIDLWSKSDMGELEAARMADRDGQGAVETGTPPSATSPSGPFVVGPPAVNGNGQAPSSAHNGNGAPPPAHPQPPRYAPETQAWLDAMRGEVDHAVSLGALDDLADAAVEGCQQHRCPEVLPRMAAHIDQRRAALNAPVDAETLRQMHIALSNAKVKSGEDHKVAASRIVGRRFVVATTNDLTFVEAVVVTQAARSAPSTGLNLDQFPIPTGVS